MCIPHGASAPISSGFIKKEKPKKHIKKISQDQFEKGDPDFIDERVGEEDSTKERKSFFKSLFS